MGNSRGPKSNFEFVMLNVDNLKSSHEIIIFINWPKMNACWHSKKDETKSCAWLCFMQQFWYQFPKLKLNSQTQNPNPTHSLSSRVRACVKSKQLNNGVLLQSTPWSWRLHYLHGSWQVRKRRAHQIRVHRRHLVNPNSISYLPISWISSLFSEIVCIVKEYTYDLSLIYDFEINNC